MIGDSLDENSTFINIKIARCDNSTFKNCKEKAEIDNFVNNLEVEFVFTNSFFD